MWYVRGYLNLKGTAVNIIINCTNYGHPALPINRIPCCFMSQLTDSKMELDTPVAQQTDDWGATEKSGIYAGGCSELGLPPLVMQGFMKFANAMIADTRCLTNHRCHLKDCAAAERAALRL
jgi:hypothetical protein